jgi:hypothetical protein
VPIEAKPLFRPDVLRSHLAAFQLPAHVDPLRPELKHWADLLASGKFVVALEGKGPKDPLDRPFAGRRMSASGQGYRYAIDLPCSASTCPPSAPAVDCGFSQLA